MTEDPILSVSFPEVSRNDAGGRVLLADVELSVHSGQVVCIVGRSGCGKSTLMRMISALVGCSEGQVLLEGKRLETFAPREWRQHVRYCFVPKAPMTGTPREFIYDLVSSGLPDLESA